MAIFRGIGGAGDSTTDATLSAVTQQATNATSSATAAASSASGAASSASAAATSASNAASSVANVDASVTSAAASATSATASKVAAAASETAAGASETAAAASESAVATSASNAASSASSAAASASTATTEATNSASSASTSTTKAGEAVTSATNAATSETNAANSASASSSSAAASLSSKNAAEVSETNSGASAVSAAASASAAASSAFGDKGTGVTTSYVSTVAVGGTTFAQPSVTGEINSDQGYFSITYAGATGITVTTLTSASTYVYIDNTGALQQQVTEPTRQDWSRKMFTMRIAVDLSTNLIIGFEYLNNPVGHYANSIRDIYSFLLANGVPFKKNQTITGRAGDLGFDVSSGTLMEFGGTGDINNANILAFDAVANAEFFLATRTAFDAGGNTDLPKTWDNAGTLTALGSTTVVGHRLYRFSNGNFVMQYGQGNYANITLAKTGAVLEDYVLNPILENATFFGWWFIQSTATNTGGTTLTDFNEYTIGIQGGSSGSLAGCLLKGNNLSDLLNASDARTNLGLGTAATTAATDYSTPATTAAAVLLAVPAQSGNSGEFLTTDGSSTAWAAVDALPSQTGNSGKYLTTDGAAATWGVLDTDANSTTKGLYEMANTISTNYSITAGNNAMSAGPIVVNSGVSVTIPSGSRWTIV